MKSQKGQSLIEVLLSAALLIILLPALFAGLLSSREGRAQQRQRTDATALLRETQEIVKIIRERGWSMISNNGTFHPIEDGNTWQLIAGSDTVGNLTREIIVSNVLRDGNGVIDPTGSVDPSTKKIEINISWSQPLTAIASSSFYITRYLDNIAFTETTEADFLLGERNDTTVVNNSGGEVILDAGGRGDWCKPNEFIVAQQDIPQDAKAQVVKAIEGKAFVGTDQASNGVFAEIDISNDYPPVPGISSTIAGYDTNDIFIDDNYAYIATDNINKDVVIIDLNTNQEVGYYNAWSWLGTAQGIYVSGNTGYVTIGIWLHSFDLSSKTGSRPRLDSEFLWGTGRRLQVVGDYAYVAVDYGWSELRLYNISNPRRISYAAKADVNGERGQEVFVNETGTRAYLATDESESKSEFFIINTQNKSGNLPVISEYDAGGMDPRGVTVVTGNKALLVGIGEEEYQVIDITNETAPVRCGGVNVDSGIYGVSAVLEQDGDAYSYIVTHDNTAEFKIIEGGPGAGYASEGTFTSSAFNPGYQTVFNRFDVTSTLPVDTNITYQIAVADSIAGSCSGINFSFVGPDGTGNSFFTEGDAIPLDNDDLGYENPGQCIKYKAYFTTASDTQTPVFEEIRVNYSP